MAKKINRSARFLNILWLIPIITLGYIGWLNLLPLGGVETYHIDVGGEDISGNAFITGPFDRISGNEDVDGISCRYLEKNLVYFELDSRRLGDADTISVKVRFKDEFPEDSKFILGPRDKNEWSYYWKEIYVPFYNQLASLPLVTENITTKVYATGNISVSKFASIDDFLQNPPLGSVIATNDKELNINQRLNQEESGKIDASEFFTKDVFPKMPITNTDQNNYLETDTSLRGSHEFYFFSDGGTLELEVTKRDINWYEGKDGLEVVICSPDETFKVMATIPDDGNSTKNKNLGPSQPLILKADNLERGVYHLVLKPMGESDDFLITHLKLNQSKLVIPGEVYLAGNLYLGGELEPMAVWCCLFSDGEIKLSTEHKSALQKVTISSEGYNQTFSIDSSKTEVSTGMLKAGIYKITSEKGDILIKVPSGYCAFTENSLFVPVSTSTLESNGTLLINSTLRGGHTLWTYVENAPLEMTITKQDLNWYDNPDELWIEVYSLNGELKGSAIIPDDGNDSKINNLGPLQSKSLKIEGLEPGAYRLELNGGSDLLIRKIEINQAKLVIDGSVYLIGMDPTYFEGGLAFDPVMLYIKDFTAKQVKFRTWHKQGLQQVSIHSDGFETKVDISKTQTDFSTSLKSGNYQLSIPNQDVLVKYEGYFSFTPDSFFLPKRCNIIDFKYDIPWLKENADYLIMSYRDYITPVEDQGWKIAEATWNKADLFIKDNKLNFCFKVPHLSIPEESIRAIPIDWIEIKVKIPPIYKRPK